MAGNGGNAPSTDPNQLKLAEQLGLYVDIWKKTVDVQQHFNDIQWRIRGLALTVATFTLGAAGLAAKDSTRIGFLSLGATVSLVGLMLWYAFYFVDRYWYHVFLKAAVDQGKSLEYVLNQHLPEAKLGGTITARSSSVYPGAIASKSYRTYLSAKRLRFRGPVGGLVRFWRRPTSMDSTKRLTWFYAVGSVPFVVVAITLQVSALVAVSQSSRSETVSPHTGPTFTYESSAPTPNIPERTTLPAQPAITPN
ncbi:hypothetical protein ACN9MI_25740 (plasmid) [Rhodococcoides fascians]|mgnify:FL=1|uniref:hypothetical protein n=1 Tax=Rhodococcoides fascians TaxID=1828 RepID=UPI003CE8E822